MKLTRREFALGAAAALPAAALPIGLVAAQGVGSGWEDALKAIVGTGKTVDGPVVMDIPEIAENGNTVPFTVSFDSPMTEKDYVKAIHILATANPQPGIGTFRFTPQSGRAAVSSRMRLARTQDVVGVAELSDGRFVMARRAVRVTIGGCGG